MKIVLFGANGGVGQLVMKYAAENGYELTPVVRENSKVNALQGYKTVKTEITADNKLLNEIIADADIVVSTIGPALDMSRKKKGTPVSDGLKIIIGTMKKYEKKRLIIIGTPTLSGPDDQSNMLTILPKVMAKLLYPNAYMEMQEMSKMIQNSTIDWTVVRFINPNLKITGSGYAYSLGDKSGKLGVSRENIAKFLVEEALAPKFIKKMPIIFNK
ncbi:NAD(P)H-binding protein [uncultured Enterococcus sp.]|uniref:NAD(P)H-binding protein n=1 Tax=uncultured Enterococcus sp. TaxID=167972 RepID=UPI002AA81C7B|nr:NAD(P)H-binding protein [uncultured Enterococcus sp.]